MNKVGSFLSQLKLYGTEGHERFILEKEGASDSLSLVTRPKCNGWFSGYFTPENEKLSVINAHINKFVIDNADAIFQQCEDVPTASLVRLKDTLQSTHHSAVGIISHILDKRMPLQRITDQVAAEKLKLQELQSQSIAVRQQVIQFREREFKRATEEAIAFQNQMIKASVDIAELPLDMGKRLRDQPNADIKFNCRDGQVHAHLAVLRGASDFFEAINDAQQDEDGMRVIDWTKYSKETVSDLIDIIYGVKTVDKLSLKELNALFLLSDYLGLDKMRRDCEFALKCILFNDATAYFSVWPDPNVRVETYGNGSSLLDSRLEKFYLNLLPEFYTVHMSEFRVPKEKVDNFFRYLEEASSVYPEDLTIKTSIGYCYRLALGTPQDADRGMSILVEAAEEGYALAQALCGVKAPHNDISSFEWAQKSAAQGNAVGESSLGCHYINGTGVPENREKAFEYFKKAAEKHNPLTLYNLALFYDGSVPGYKKDIKKAIEALEKASLLGYKPAREKLKSQYGIGS